MLKQSAMWLLDRYDDLEIISVAAEYGEGLRQLDMRRDEPKLILWLGSSIGNFNLKEAVGFLKSIVKSLSGEDHLLIGFDLEKAKGILEQAYNDSRGVTAAFNLNLLTRINRELGGEFDLKRFTHRAVYNEVRSRIEMYLVSTSEQEVYIDALDRSYHFDKGERIHTENSHKFSSGVIDALADKAGMKIVERWSDARAYFNLTLFRPDRH
jgi:L-histidine N-alpha-methyltransferase